MKRYISLDMELLNRVDMTIQEFILCENIQFGSNIKPHYYNGSKKELAESAGISRATLYRMIDNLIAKGYIKPFKKGYKVTVNYHELGETKVSHIENSYSDEVSQCETKVSHSDTDEVSHSDTHLPIRKKLLSKRDREEEEEEEVFSLSKKKRFEKITDFINFIKFEFVDISIEVKDRNYFIDYDGYLKAKKDNTKVSIGLAKEIFKRMYEIQDKSIKYLEAKQAEKYNKQGS